MENNTNFPVLCLVFGCFHFLQIVSCCCKIKAPIWGCVLGVATVLLLLLMHVRICQLDSLYWGENNADNLVVPSSLYRTNQTDWKLHGWQSSVQTNEIPPLCNQFRNNSKTKYGEKASNFRPIRNLFLNWREHRQALLKRDVATWWRPQYTDFHFTANLDVLSTMKLSICTHMSLHNVYLLTVLLIEKSPCRLQDAFKVA